MRDDVSRIVLAPVSQESKDVCIVELKVMARRLLPTTSILRNLILTEPDYLPRQAVLPKVEIFVKLLYQELSLR